jgi:hypothetical protein
MTGKLPVVICLFNVPFACGLVCCVLTLIFTLQLICSYKVGCDLPGKYRVALDSDAFVFGGHGRVSSDRC